VNQQLEADQQQLEADIESKRTCLEQLMLPRDCSIAPLCAVSSTDIPLLIYISLLRSILSAQRPVNILKLDASWF